MPRLLILALGWLLCAAQPALAHFGLIIPSEPIVLAKSENPLLLDLAFAHPFTQQGLAMARPRGFFVLNGGKKTDLTPLLTQASYLGQPTWQCRYELKRPGVYIFADEPEPYYEPAEDKFILHYAKTVVSAFGGEEGWDAPCGLPLEIVPLSRPFGNYAGNVFCGQVLYLGRPLPGAMVEVEALNTDGRAAPAPCFETQTVKTDANGVFVFGIPWAGWWGFAALHESGEKLERDGQPKPVELGGIFWTKFARP